MPRPTHAFHAHTNPEKKNPTAPRSSGDEARLAALPVEEREEPARERRAAYLGRERLRWVHCSHAGIEKSARPEVFDEGLLVTGAAGRSAVRLIV